MTNEKVQFRKNIIEKYVTYMQHIIYTFYKLKLYAFDAEVGSYIRYNYFKNREGFVDEDEDEPVDDDIEPFNMDDMLSNDEILSIIGSTIVAFRGKIDFCTFYKTVIDGFYRWNIITRPDYPKIQNWVCDYITEDDSISVDNKTEMTNFVKNYKCSWWQ